MLDLQRIADAVRYEGGVSRRLFLAYGAALSSLPLLAGRTLAQPAKPRFSDDPFQLGMASGDPSHDGMALWTRLTPKPFEPDGGLDPAPIEVAWEIANDEAMKDVVQKGTTLAVPQLAHSVHVEVGGLKPNQWYFYRFRAGDATSPVGRTRTMPDPTTTPDRLFFAFASCQHFETGLYTAYEHMAKDELDLVVHLGDYIYEGAGQDKRVRKHLGKKLYTLEDYRIRHAQYRADAHLKGMHARCPWVVTWDDHEFENNYANDIPEKRRPKKDGAVPMEPDPVAFLEHRANAYQAYYEAMPLRKRSVPHGPHMKLYRTIDFGRLASFQVLDTRQYRTDQPNGDGLADLNEDALRPTNTLLGAEQAGWLKSRLIQSAATWNVLAQQVMMGMVDFIPGETKRYSMDQWPGAAYERMKLMQFIAERRVPNPVVLTGDIHTNWVNELRVDDRQGEMPVVAAEFVGTSISSGGNGPKDSTAMKSLMAENACVKFFNSQRGYVRCLVTPKEWRSDYQIVANVTSPGGDVETKASFVIEAGKPGVKPA